MELKEEVFIRNFKTLVYRARVEEEATPPHIEKNLRFYVACFNVRGFNWLLIFSEKKYGFIFFLFNRLKRQSLAERV